MYLIQFLLVAFFFFAIIKVINRFRQKEISSPVAIFWIIFWLIAGLITLLPDSTFYAARLMGVGRGADLVVYIALVLLFFITFKLMVKMEKIKREITVLTRKDALKK